MKSYKITFKETLKAENEEQAVPTAVVSRY